jgi:putative phosphoesterase
MKIAVFSDIHGNFPALCSGLRTAERRGAERFFVAGDLVGRGPHPVEVLRLIEELQIPAIRGNMEKKLLRFRDGIKGGKSSVQKRKTHFAWTAQQLKEAEWDYVVKLPDMIELQIEGFNILIVHGSPLSVTDSIYPDITYETLRAQLGEKSPDILICGHTHVPFVKVLGGIRVINCGAVGMSAQGTPRGTFALVDLSPKSSPRCHITRFLYPFEYLEEDIRLRAIPGVEKEMFLKGV